jgi:hypothetical protein
VIGRKTNDTTDTAFAVRDDQIAFVYFAVGNIGLKSSKIIIKNECRSVIGILLIAGSFVGRAEITLGIVLGRNFRIGLFFLALPRAFGAVRRDNDPLAR